MNPRQIVILLGSVCFLVGSILPKPIIERATNKPFENQLLARLCLAAIGLIGILTVHSVP